MPLLDDDTEVQETRIYSEYINSDGSITMRTSVLVVRDVQVEDAGIYTCGAENGVNNVIGAIETATSSLIVQGKKVNFMHFAKQVHCSKLSNNYASTCSSTKGCFKCCQPNCAGNTRGYHHI